MKTETSQDLAQHVSHYVPAVDGLRTVAVTAVLLFHVGFGFAAGGYIGVDIFFVISGFLITGNILRKGDGFSFADFYSRRVRRLIPAMAATVLISLIAGWFILSSKELSQLGNEALYASLSVSNILYWLQSGYFDTDSESKVLLHTWSLGVEEQFYLIWPLLVFFAAKMGRTALAGVLVAMSLVSFAAVLILNPSFPSSVFFLTPFRMFQFGIGGIIAIFALKLPEAVSSALVLAALIVVCALTYILGGASLNAWLTMLAPAAAAGAIIIGSRGKLVNMTLGSMPMTWIGQRSYSIYLAHWPLIVLYREATGHELEVIESLALLAGSIILGTILHWAVEARFRWSKTKKTENLVYAGTALAVAISIFAGSNMWAMNKQGGVSNALLNEDVLKVRREAFVRQDLCNMASNQDAGQWVRELCYLFATDRDNWLIIGDSHAADIYMPVKEAFQEINWLQYTRNGCPVLLPDVQRPDSHPQCVASASDWLEELVLDKRLKGVLIVSNWSNPTDLEPLTQTLEYLQSKDVNFYVVGERPKFEVNVIDFLLENEDVATLPRETGLKTGTGDYYAALHERFGNRVLNFIDIQCPENCPILDEEGQPLYVDVAHFSGFAGKYFMTEVRRRLQNILLPNSSDETQLSEGALKNQNELCNIGSRQNADQWARKLCFGFISDQENWLLIGDSHAADLSMPIREAFQEINWLQFTQNDCPALLPDVQGPDSFPQCIASSSLWLEDLALDERLDGVLLVSDWANPADLEPLTQTLEYLQANNVNFYVVHGRAQFDVDISDFLSKNRTATTLSREEHLSEGNDDFHSALTEKFGDKVLNFIDIQCPEDCPLVDEEGNALYADEENFSSFSGRYFVPAIKRALQYEMLPHTYVDPKLSIDTLQKRRDLYVRQDQCNMGSAQSPDEWDEGLCFGFVTDRENWLVVGDSYAADIYMTMKEAFQQINWLQYTRNECPALLPDALVSEVSSQCITSARIWLEDLVMDERLDGVIIASNWSTLEPLSQTLEYLQENEVNFYVVNNRPEFKVNVIDFLIENEGVTTLSPEEYLQEDIADFQSLNAEFGSRILNFAEIQCPEECPVLDEDGNPLYINDRNFTSSAAKFFKSALYRRMEKAITPSSVSAATPSAEIDPRLNVNILSERRNTYIRQDTCNLNTSQDSEAWDRDICYEAALNRDNWLIIGDGYAADIYMLAKDAFPEITWLQYTHNDCLALLPDALASDISPQCATSAEIWLKDLVRDNSLNGVLIASDWSNLENQEPLIRTLEYLQANEVNFYVVSKGPEFNVNIIDFLIANDDVTALSRKEYLKADPGDFDIILREQFGDRVLNLTDIQCPEECPITDEKGFPLYINEQNLSSFGAKYFKAPVRKGLEDMIKDVQ